MSVLDTSMKKALQWIKKVQTYIEQSCLFLGMAGTGKSKILLEMQITLLNK